MSDAFRSIPAGAHKAKAKLAFLAYERALRDGDTAAAQAAKARFLDAGNALKANRLRPSPEERKL